MFFKTLVGGIMTCALALSFPTAAHGEEGPKDTERLETVVSSQSDILSPKTQIVIISQKRTSILDSSAFNFLSSSLKESNLELSNYVDANGDPVSDRILLPGETLYLFQSSFGVKAKVIKLAPPVIKIPSRLVSSGEERIQDEGVPGEALQTTVTPKTRKNGQAGSTETFTVIKPPKPKIVLVALSADSTKNPAPLDGCYNGTSVPDAVDPDIKAVHAAVCAQFPEILVYGTFRTSCTHGCDHANGKAVDIMVSGERGNEISDFLIANLKKLNIEYLIYEQRIYAEYKPYWRPMEDRGSITQNHFDHVHVTVY